METYCYCKSPGNEGRFMIQCHICKDWFHGDCLPKKLNARDADLIKYFHCPECFNTRGPSIRKFCTILLITYNNYKIIIIIIIFVIRKFSILLSFFTLAHEK